MKTDSIPDRLRTFARQQPLYLVTASGVAAIFWAATGAAPSLRLTLIYSFVLGNLVAVTLEHIPTPRGITSLAGRAGFALLLLLVTTPVFVTISTGVIFWTLGNPLGNNFWSFLAAGWKFPSVATLLFGGGYLLYKLNRDLRTQNLVLQNTITLDRAVRTSEAAELQQAREIQQNLLPKKVPQIAGFDIAGTWEPAKVVGGDYYDVIQLGNDKVALCIADVSGKGISAALLMANVQAAVRAFATDSASSAEVCSRLNSVLCTNTATDKFVTLFYGVLEAKTGILQFTNAGHLKPVVVCDDGSIARLENDGALLGVFPDWKYESSRVQLTPGHILVLFTDGITEAETKEAEQFGEQRLMDSLGQLRHLTAQELQSKLLAQVKQFCNGALADDATMIVVSAGSFAAEPVHEPLRHKQLSYSGVTK